MTIRNGNYESCGSNSLILSGFLTDDSQFLTRIMSLGMWVESINFVRVFN